ncbi:hypothetical protein [Fundidesulfovibrio agrisoli]|uniref:hypothetical protein n=1 Tax=Fundidesulfovibrio agrisoli TaxID=2922717 RepID=UPI001FAD1D1B|nr:hypothetical protein [Fundidesulfovibrio agrisoli]
MHETETIAQAAGGRVSRGAAGKLALWAAYLLVALLPGLFLSAAYDALVQEKPGALVPYAHWDTYDYVLEARGFAAAGFNMGRFTFNEVEAGLKDSPFGPHSFTYPILMSAASRLTGASFPQAAPLINLTFMGLCLGVLLLLAGPGWFTVGILALAVVSVPDFLHTGATFWQENTNYSLAILLSALFYRMLLARAPKARWFWGAATFAVLAAASLIRPIWGLLYIAFFTLALPGAPLFRGLSLVLGGACFVGNYLLYQFTAPPFVGNSSGARLAAEAALSGKAAYAAILKRIADSIADNYIGALYQIKLAPFVLVVFGFSLAGILAVFINRRFIREKFESERKALDVAIVFGGILLGYFAAAMGLQGLEPRHLYPCFFFSFLFLALTDVSRVLIAVVLGAQLASAAMNMQSVQNHAYELARAPQAREFRISRFSNLAGRLMPYTRQANSWCNTVLVGNHETATEYLGLPAGLGLSHILIYKSYVPPAKSRFLLLKDDSQVKFFSDSNKISFLSHTAGGELYLNQDCPCSGEGPSVLQPGDFSESLNELERLEAVRKMRSSPYLRAMESRGIRLVGGDVMLEASFDIDATALTDAQLSAGLLTGEAATRIRDTFDRMQLVLTFIRSPGGFSAPQNPRLFAHCRSGLFNTYDLPDDVVEDLAAGRPLKPVSLKYNERDLFICEYW